MLMNSRKSDKWHELRREGMSSADEDLQDYSKKTNHNKLGKKQWSHPAAPPFTPLQEQTEPQLKTDVSMYGGMVDNKLI